MGASVAGRKSSLCKAEGIGFRGIGGNQLEDGLICSDRGEGSGDTFAYAKSLD